MNIHNLRFILIIQPSVGKTIHNGHYHHRRQDRSCNNNNNNNNDLDNLLSPGIHCK